MKETFLRALFLVFLGVGFSALFASSVSATNSNYGAGGYGQCQYGLEGSTCSISITNNNTNQFYLSLSITPTQAGSCTIQSDQVGVTTFDPGGYTLTLGDQATDSNLDNGSNNIPITTGTQASPITLSNKWGYRIDSYSGFGAGPTSAVTNSSLSSLTFAGIKTSSQTADTIASTSSYSSSAVTTTIWYGVCLNYSIAIPTGYYSSTVLYTATAN